ncbi:MAG: 50S ribosomal protein L13 [Candidatus Aenigmarchaeota archaeon]|nr:50S ribosomal protein L13 [Candidatus Aenigmarchaeota archaeon]
MNREEIVIDAANVVAGRAASTAAKELLKGKKVYMVNAEKAMVNGDPKYTIVHYKEKLARGDPYKGPFYPKVPDRILKRMVRGMLPYKKPMGKNAFKRLRVYSAVPEELQGKEFKTVPGKVGKKSISLKELSQRLKWLS